MFEFLFQSAAAVIIVGGGVLPFWLIGRKGSVAESAHPAALGMGDHLLLVSRGLDAIRRQGR